jgi:hypothetical protein
MKTPNYIAKFLSSLLILLNYNVLTLAQKHDRPKKGDRKEYSIEQAISEEAQLHTVAFDGLAFITGTFGADTFFPPGKVADFFGFQYMRDIDKNEKGHNTDFLTTIANNVINVLNKEQLQQLIQFGNEQAPIYEEFAKKRLVLIKAFRYSFENGKELNKTEVIKYCSKLYELDAQLSYNRALVVGKIISSFTKEQKDYLAKLKFDNSSTWPQMPENLDKRSMSHRAHVAAMTYASELFSWYAGSVKADTYFCPERHGTYFGGFYMKDYPAMGNHGYNISTKLTGDKGKEFIETLSANQSSCLNETIVNQVPLLNKIVKIRESVSTELRKAMNNEMPDKEKVYSLIKQYGEIDGEMSYEYATCFAQIFKSLNAKQKESLMKLRDQYIFPKGAYIYSDPVDLPEDLDCSFLLKEYISPFYHQ